MIPRNRPGVALVLAILLLVVLECILLGVLETARQHRVIAANRTRLLQLQLHAEGAVRRALVEWPAQDIRDDAVIVHERPHVVLRQSLAPLDGDLVLIETAAIAPPPARLRQAASLLALPPVLPPTLDPAEAALTAGSAVVSESAIIGAGPPPDCAANAGAALRTSGPAAILPGASVGGIVVENHEPMDPERVLDRAAADSLLQLASGDTVLTGSAAGLLLARGSISFAPDVEFRGLVIGGAHLHLAETSRVAGAIWISGVGSVHGTLSRDPCAVEDAIRAGGLRRARPAGGRAWLPVF